MTLPHERSARQHLLDLACDVSLYRVIGGHHYWRLAERAGHVGKIAVRAGLPLRTPLAELFMDQRDQHQASESLGWYYRRSYGSEDTSLDPFHFFNLSYGTGFVSIESRAIAGARGSIRVIERSMRDIFTCAGYAHPVSFLACAYNPYPTVGSPLLMRIDGGDAQIGQLRLEAGDIYPDSGSICFGEPLQECEQLSAFLRVEAHVRALFAMHGQTDDQHTRRGDGATAAIYANTCTISPHPRNPKPYWKIK